MGSHAAERTLPDIALLPLEADDREQFVTDNQEAFLYGATQEFGLRDDHFEEDGQIISRETIGQAIDAAGAEAYRIVLDGRNVGGLVLNTDDAAAKGELELLFVSPHAHSRGIGQAAWRAVERMHPEVRVWGLVTPYFETRNIHFYVNKLGFSIVEYFNSHHPDPAEPDGGSGDWDDGMFRFEKVMAAQGDTGFEEAGKADTGCGLELEVLDGELTVCKVASADDVDLSDDLLFVGKTNEEVSLVCKTASVPAGTVAREDGWRGLRIKGPLGFSLVGVLARISGALAANGIALFAVSTFDTDYILIKAVDFEKAFEVLEQAQIAAVGDGQRDSLALR